jgi:pyrroloquinoline-quinone synthase
MKIRPRLDRAIEPKRVLNHPFYRDWMDGALTREQLVHYCAQYYPHVSAFPRFVSAIHSRCEAPAARKALFANLSEEEGQGQAADHPELWLRFAEGLGARRERIERAPIGERARGLVRLYFELCQSSFPEGLGALIAYESQVPEVAEAKLFGLARFYGVADGRSTAFFRVHLEADRLHSDSCARLLDELSESAQDLALGAAAKASAALWDFLSEVHGHAGAA